MGKGVDEAARWQLAGCLFCASAVLLGAFGAHLLKERLTSIELSSYETAVRYLMYHGFALLILGLRMRELANRFEHFAGVGFFVGTLLFSGSLFTLLASGLNWLGILTPVGGSFLIAAWISFAVSFARKTTQA